MSKTSQQAQRDADGAWYANQLLRLGAYAPLPFETESKAEMVRVLMTETNRDRTHAERVIDAAAGGAPPTIWTVGELRNFIGSTRERQVRRDLHCEACGGTGWQWVERTVNVPSVGSYRGSGVTKCPRGCEPSGMGFTPEALR